MTETPSYTRFEVELEFIQSLSNISYLQYLFVTLQLHNDPCFLEYLKYLHTQWVNTPSNAHHDNTTTNRTTTTLTTRVKYIKNIIYPNSLHILATLNSFISNNRADQIPAYITTQGANIMNEMVSRWET